MLPRLRAHRHHRAGCPRALTLVLAAVVVHPSLRPQNFVSGLLACRWSIPTAASTAWRPRGSTALASRGGESPKTFEVGDKVLAVCEYDGKKYPGIIVRANSGGTFAVKWDDPEGGPAIEDIAPDKMENFVVFTDYVVGDDVEAVDPDDRASDKWYPATVAQVNDDGTFSVKWDYPEGGPETSTVKPEGMKRVVVFKDYKVNDVVEGIYPGDGRVWPATVVKVNDDGTFRVKWQNDYFEDSIIGPKSMRFPPITFDQLEVGQKYTGRVRDVLDWGAFVDIGAERAGLLHISRITGDHVKNVHDLLKEGQEVEVWVSGKQEGGRIGLSMIEGMVDTPRRDPQSLATFARVPRDEWLTGRVSRALPFGAFVSVTLPGGGPSADGLVHISEFADRLITNVRDEVHPGQEVQVRVLSVDIRAGQLRLSMRRLDGGRGGGGGGSVKEQPDVSALEWLPPNMWFKGTVDNIFPYGAFVKFTTEDGMTASGLVHITQIKDHIIERVKDELSIGEEVQVRIIKVDVMAGVVNLSMRPLETMR